MIPQNHCQKYFKKTTGQGLMIWKLGQTLMPTALSKIHPSVCRAQPRVDFALQDTNTQRGSHIPNHFNTKGTAISKVFPAAHATLLSKEK